MKLQQLRYVHEVAKQGLNISQAAEKLHTSQSGVSKQIQLLEEELNLQIFRRNGKRLTGLTEIGTAIIDLADRVLQEVGNIRQVGQEFNKKDEGSLTLATTHTQARYRLPGIVSAFMQRYPNIKLHIHQGAPRQVAEQVIKGEADIGITSEVIGSNQKLLGLPCYQWNRCVIMPPGHPLLDSPPLTLAKIASYPLITYDFAVTGGSLVSRVFAEAGLQPNVVLTALDADVIKTYVNLELGIGLMANIAYNAGRDHPLAMLDASHLFPPSTTYLVLNRHNYLRGYMYEFIGLLAPQFDRRSVDAAFQGAVLAAEQPSFA